MKLQNIPLDQIVSNPWRDEDHYPLDEEHIRHLRASIKDHGFFSTLRGRRRDGKIQLAFGHARLAAARKAREETVPILIDDIDDDEMLQLMTVENATQRGANAGAILNEVEAVTRRLIEGLLDRSDNCPTAVAKAFTNKAGIEQARIKLRRGTNVHMVLGNEVVRAYLGKGSRDDAKRGERQIREAISTLKQSGRYDKIVDEELLKYPEPVADKAPAKKSEVQKAKEPKRHARVLDERTASVFPNDHQFHAFREAITSPNAQQVIPVNQQLALAKEIMKRDDDKKQVSAPYIKMMVQAQVKEGIKQQREIDKEERERMIAENIEAEIDAQLHRADKWVWSLISEINKLHKLAAQYPDHPKIGGFAARLERLAESIRQFSKKLK